MFTWWHHLAAPQRQSREGHLLQVCKVAHKECPYLRKDHVNETEVLKCIKWQRDVVEHGGEQMYGDWGKGEPQLNWIIGFMGNDLGV